MKIVYLIRHAKTVENEKNIYCGQKPGKLSKKGREDYVRVKLIKRKGELLAQPIFSKSGIIKSLIRANGLVRVPYISEGIVEDSIVEVFLL